MTMNMKTWLLAFAWAVGYSESGNRLLSVLDSDGLILPIVDSARSREHGS